ncbi:MAG TPA: hypothetical protein VEL11_07710 [Candidatus Bathyarchaeia archaeon]|nr:hypothetical protein [Candidatus Bathyarchaeia archaeon]
MQSDSRFGTLDAIAMFIPKTVMGTPAAVMNTLRIIGGAIRLCVIMQIFLTHVVIDYKVRSFPTQSSP